MIKPLAPAQIQSVREIKKKANIKKSNKKATIFVLALLVSLILIYICYLGYTYYIDNKYEYKETESGISFFSKDYGVKSAISKILDSDEIYLFVNIYDDNSTNIDLLTETVVFYNSILTYKQKNLTTTINTVDYKNNIVTCVSNKGDVLTGEKLETEECVSIFEGNKNKIVISTINPKQKTTEVYALVDKDAIEIKLKSFNDLRLVSYIILKSKYQDIEEILLKIEKETENLPTGLETN